jgi:hypothetical protein
LHFFFKWSFIGAEDRKTKEKAGGSPLQPKFNGTVTYFFFAVFFAVAFFAGFFAAAFFVAIQFTPFLSPNNRGDLSYALPIKSVSRKGVD